MRIREKGLTPKILPHFVSKAGIVFDIPTQISEKEFLESTRSSIEILKVQRITRKRKDGNGSMEIIPTKNMKIIFKGNSIPREVFFGYTKINVKYFIPFGQCYRCFRYNHFAQNCKQTYELCRSCYNKHEKEEECLEVKCNNCKGNHPPIEKYCPAREKAYALKKMMVIENLSIKEARTRYSNIFSNRFPILGDNEEFPTLRTSGDRNINLNRHSEATKDLHRILPYAKVAKVNTNREREETNIRKIRAEHQKVLKEHSINLPYNTSAKNNQLRTEAREDNQMVPLSNSQLSENHDKAIEILSKVSADTTNLIMNWSNGNFNSESYGRFLLSLRDSISRGMNLIDTDRIDH